MDMFDHPDEAYASQYSINDLTNDPSIFDGIHDVPVDPFTAEHAPFNNSAYNNGVEANRLLGVRASVSTSSPRPQLVRNTTHGGHLVHPAIESRYNTATQALPQLSSNASGSTPIPGAPVDAAWNQLDMGRRLEHLRHDVKRDVHQLATQVHQLKGERLSTEQRLASVEAELRSIDAAFRPLAVGDRSAVEDGVQTLVSRVQASTSSWDRRINTFNELAEVVKVLIDITERLKKTEEEQDTLSNWSRKYDSTEDN